MSFLSLPFYSNNPIASETLSSRFDSQLSSDSAAAQTQVHFFLNPLNCISYFLWQGRRLDISILNAYWKSDFASLLFLPVFMKEQHIFPRLVMIQPQDFSADLICRTPAESDKWPFTSRDRCSLQNHLLPSLLSLHRLLLHLHLPPSSIFSTPGQLCPLIRSCLMLQMDQWWKVSELKCTTCSPFL